MSNYFGFDILAVSKVLDRNFFPTYLYILMRDELQTLPIFTPTKGYLYLAAIVDKYLKKIVEYSIKQRLTQKLSIEVVNMAIHSRLIPGLIVYTGRGSLIANNFSKGGESTRHRKGNAFIHVFKGHMSQRSDFQLTCKHRPLRYIGDWFLEIL